MALRVYRRPRTARHLRWDESPVYAAGSAYETEPIITVEELKTLGLRAEDDNTQNELLDFLTRSVSRAVERLTGRLGLVREVSAYYRSWPNEGLLLPFGPYVALSKGTDSSGGDAFASEVATIDEGVETAVQTSGLFTVSHDHRHAVRRTTTSLSDYQEIRVTAKIGHSTREAIHPMMRQAAIQAATDLFANPSSVVTGTTVTILPTSAMVILEHAGLLLPRL